MESQVVLIIGLAFIAALGFILKQANPAPPAKQIKERPVRREKPQKQKRPSQKKSFKKGEQIKEWVGVDTAAKDAQDMLEFLKGRDPKEISKALKAQNPKPKATVQPQAPVVQNNKKGKNQKQQAQNDSARENVDDGFSTIKKAPKKQKQQPKEEEEEKVKLPKKKFFLKTEEEEFERIKKEKQEARAKGGDNKEKRERGPREDRPKRERKERKEGEESNSESDAERPPRQKRERREKPEGEQAERPPRVIVAPNIPRYEAPDITDMLNSITSEYKATSPVPKQKRESSVFSNIPGEIVTNRILSYLTARELLTLARVNQYFRSAIRKDSLWRNLYLKEFGSENTSGIKSWMREYKKRKTGKGSRQGDKKGNKEEKKANTPKQQ